MGLVLVDYQNKRDFSKPHWAVGILNTDTGVIDYYNSINFKHLIEKTPVKGVSLSPVPASHHTEGVYVTPQKYKGLTLVDEYTILSDLSIPIGNLSGGVSFEYKGLLFVYNVKGKYFNLEKCPKFSKKTGFDNSTLITAVNEFASKFVFGGMYRTSFTHAKSIDLTGMRLDTMHKITNIAWHSKSLRSFSFGNMDLSQLTSAFCTFEGSSNLEFIDLSQCLNDIPIPQKLELEGFTVATGTYKTAILIPEHAEVLFQYLDATNHTYGGVVNNLEELFVLHEENIATALMLNYDLRNPRFYVLKGV